MMNTMSRKIGDKLTDKNGVKLKAVAGTFECDGCFYDNDCDWHINHPAFLNVWVYMGCAEEVGFIFVEDK